MYVYIYIYIYIYTMLIYYFDLSQLTDKVHTEEVDNPGKGSTIVYIIYSIFI